MISEKNIPFKATGRPPIDVLNGIVTPKTRKKWNQ